MVGLRRGSWGMSWTGAALLQQPQGWEGVWRGACGPQPCEKHVPAPFCQLVFNPWAERRFFSLVGGKGAASGPPLGQRTSPPPAKPLGELSPAGWDNLPVIRASADCSVSSGRIRGDFFYRPFETGPGLRLVL